MLQRIPRSGLAATTVCASLVLSACGGGGSGSSGGSGGSGDNATLKGGAFGAQVTYANDETSVADTLISPSGDFLIAFKNGDLSFGTLDFNDSSISGTGTDYYRRDDSWQRRDGTIEGTVQSEESATFTAEFADSPNSTVALMRENQFSDLGISLEQVSASYTMEKDDQPSYLVVTVGDDGSIDGKYQSACTFNGKLSVPDSSINIFEITYKAESCDDPDRNGDYSGVGAFDPDAGQMQFAAHNGEVAMFFEGTR